MDKRKGRAWIYGAAVAVLVLLCGILATMQYQWIGEISRMEQVRIRESLQTTLNRLSQEFNSEISTACAALMPTNSQVEQMGREEAYAARYAAWSSMSRHRALFRRAGVAIPQGDAVALRMLDPEKGQVLPAEWPQQWQSLRVRLNQRIQGAPARGPISPPDSMLIEVPRFGSQGPDRGRPSEQDWLVVELDLDYIRGSMLPDMLDRYLAGAGGLSYAVEISQRENPSAIVYRSGSRESIGQSAEATVMLFDNPQMMRGGERRGGFKGPPPRWTDGEMKAPRRGPPPGEPGRGRWRMSVRYQEGTIAQIVDGTRRRYLAFSGLLFLLLLATAIAVVQFSRRSHRLAELQMNFVAGVSHELRTPLTVIRTAAYSLRHRFSEQPAQVAKYAQLIEEESAKLTLLAEQVLRYGKTQSGRILQDREPVPVQQLIEEGLQASRAGHGEDDFVVEQRIDADLPLVLADSAALKHAIQNLLENAVKYGTEGGNWIGVSAAKVDAGGAVEIRVSDRGPGIPEEEQPYIFDAFYRGSRALRDQVRGTGLGLSLVKKIVEAHGGTIRLESAPMKGSEFIVRLPAAPAEFQDEFAHSLG